MINRVVLVGRITRDPELRKTQSDLSCVNFTLACNRRFAQEGGQEADFINCVAWRQSADFIANYVKQGALLGVEGRIQTRNYKDQNNRTVYVTEVVCDNVQILAQKRENQTSASYQPSQQQNTYQPVSQQNTVEPTDQQSEAFYENNFGTVLDIASDDLPF